MAAVVRVRRDFHSHRGLDYINSKIIGRFSMCGIASSVGHRDFRRHFMDRRILELAAVHLQLIAVGAVAVVHKRGIAENLVAQLQLHTGRHIRGVGIHRHRTTKRHAVFRSCFLYVQNLVAVRRRQLKRDRHCRRNGIYWSIIPTRSSTIGFGIHITAGPADIQTSQSIQTIEESRICKVMKPITIPLRYNSGRPSSRHKVRLVHGHEKFLAGNFSSIHGERRHILTGIRGVEVLKLEGTTVLKGNDKIIAITGQHGFIGGKVKNKPGFRCAYNSLRSSGNRLGKSYVSHGNLLKSIRKRKERGENSKQKSPVPVITPVQGLLRRRNRRRSYKKRERERERERESIKNPAKSVGYLQQ